MVAASLPILIALLPAIIVIVALARSGYAFNTRTVPADALRIGTGVVFAAWVVPAWGLLAAQAAAWWWVRGWPLLSGGLLWPTAAMLVFLGLRASPFMLHLALMIALGMGVCQVLLAISQKFKLPIFYVNTPEGPVQGTVGHRTGLAIYLALLVPLGFMTPYGWVLAGIYGIGLFLARSSVGWAAAIAGLTWVHPQWWAVALALIGFGLAHRFLKWNGGHIKERIFEECFRARFKIWLVALLALRSWPYWLIGRGADSFHLDARTWIYNYKLPEQYKEAHNDYVEFVYEYGLLGVGVFGWFLWDTLLPALRGSDPLTGALLGFGVAALGNFPTRVAPLVGLAALVLVTVLQRGAMT